MSLLTLSKLCLSCLFFLYTYPGITQSKIADFSYIHPVDGSINLNPEQSIILKYFAGFNPETIGPECLEVRGSKSGFIPVEFLLSQDATTAIFKPTQKFQLGEDIYIHVKKGIKSSSGTSMESLNFSFSVIRHDRNEILERLKQMQSGSEENQQNFDQEIPNRQITDNNLPVDYPPATVISYGEHDNEYIFINLNSRNPASGWEKYLTILDSYGTPVFYEKDGYNRSNFSILSNGMLNYARNFLINSDEEKYFIMDSSYTVIDSVNTGNGYILDAHDMILLSNGHYLVMSYDPQPVNMSLVVAGGNPNAIVTGLVLQEVDNNKNVFFQWRSWDHFQITDATADIDLTAVGIDYVHGNAFYIDHDGNILLSSRHLDEITKINFASGNIIWRFGLNSENNMFEIYDDPYGFTHQHDIRVLPNGHYTLFDNGNLRNPQFTQVLEYEINEVNLTATLVWNYQHGQTVFAGSAGGFRTQANGERIICWGGTSPLGVTELKADNNLLREFFFPQSVISYRAAKYMWETNIFETQSELSMGNYAGYSDGKENLLYIYNNSDQVVKITSAYKHTSDFEVLTEFPLSIFPNSYTHINILFQPADEGEYSDRLTLNCDNEGNTRRIARQLSLRGIFIDDSPSVFFEPSFGSSNISPDTNIIITFDEPVRKTLGGEIQNEDIPQLVDLKKINNNGDEVSFSGTINEDKTMITITPDQILLENQQYYIKLKHGLVADLDGNIINLDQESYFTTGLLTSYKIETEQDIYIYPNPFTDRLIILNPDHSDNIINVFNGSGKLIYTKTDSRDKTIINMSLQPGGIYFVKVTDKKSGASMVFKTIKNTTSH